MNKILITSLVSLVAGLGAGWGLHPAASSATAPGDAGVELVAAPLTGSASSVVASVDLTAMRAMVREELAAAKLGQGGNAATTATAVPSSAVTTMRSGEALQTVDSMLASGTWDASQRRAFEQNVLLLDPTQRQQAVQRLAIGINNGSIRLHSAPGM
jgi:hypothetical protein